MSQTLEYETRFGGSVTDRCTCYIASLDFDFLERVSAWIKEHYPDGQISGTFSRETIRAVEYVSNGRYRLSISCAQNKAGIAAKAALFNAFFDESGRRFDMDADAEKAKILRDIERGKAAAHSVAAAPDKETKTMLIYRDPATGWLYRVSPQPENGIYAMQYRDPANSVVWKPDITWNTNAVYRDRKHLQEGLEARAKRDGWELVSSSASSEPPEVVDKGEEYSPCDTCRCPDCIDPVSYTHLSFITSCPSKKSYPTGVLLPPRHRPRLARPRRPMLMRSLMFSRSNCAKTERIPIMAMPNGVEAVSYTHLDVYKRQP